MIFIVIFFSILFFFLRYQLLAYNLKVLTTKGTIIYFLLALDTSLRYYFLKPKLDAIVLQVLLLINLGCVFCFRRLDLFVLLARNRASLTDAFFG